MHNPASSIGVAGGIIIDKAALSSPNSLKEGGFVFLRVIEPYQGASGGAQGGTQSGLKQYVVSFGGMRFVVSSKLPLKAGDAFRAQIQIRNGVVELVTQKSTASTTAMSGGVTQLTNPEELAAFLTKLNLPPDDISLTLIRFLQQSGLTFRPALLDKARRLAQKFPGLEDIASEVALLLEEKGIEADIDSVSEMLSLLFGDFNNDEIDMDRGKHQENRKQKNRNSKDNNTDGDDIASQDGNYSFSLDKNYSPDNDFIARVSSLPPGVLTLVNHIKSGNLHWLVLPFEIQDEGNTISSGTLRILCDLSKKKVEKILISMSSGESAKSFAIDFEPSLAVRFCFEPQLSETLRSKHEELLKEQFQQIMNNSNISIQYSSDLAGALFFSDNLPLNTVSDVI